MGAISRRDFGKSMLASVFTTALIETLSKADLLAAPIKPLVNKWLLDLEDMCHSLKENQIKQIEWQKQIETLLSTVDAKDVLRAINFNKLVKQIKYPKLGEVILSVDYIKMPGISNDVTYIKQLFAVKRDRGIVPHGHHNMATMHMILSGEMQSWHYDRVRDEGDFIFIKPTDDRVGGPGYVSTISDDKDNVHRFKGISDVAFAFNVIVAELDADKAPPSRDLLDPNGEKVDGELIRARRVEPKEAYELYG